MSTAWHAPLRDGSCLGGLSAIWAARGFAVRFCCLIQNIPWIDAWSQGQAQLLILFLFLAKLLGASWDLERDFFFGWVQGKAPLPGGRSDLQPGPMCRGRSMPCRRLDGSTHSSRAQLQGSGWPKNPTARLFGGRATMSCMPRWPQAGSGSLSTQLFLSKKKKRRMGPAPPAPCPCPHVLPLPLQPSAIPAATRLP